MKNGIIPVANADLVVASGAETLLDSIRPSWQSKELINRVKKLILVDPSSACQRLLNATIHDLREKVVIAGIDIAREAAKQNRLPPIDRAGDIEDYSTAKLIDLSHHMGLLTRPEWRRLCRCYEIRRDLEHEDDQYEAGVADIVYIFETCISAVLSKDPIQLIRIEDVKDLIQEASPAIPSQALLEDFEHAPQLRQEEILKFLVGICFDVSQPDLVRQNAHTFLGYMSEVSHRAAKLTLVTHMQERVGKKGLDAITMYLANTLQIVPYFKKAQLRDYFEDQFKLMQKIGHRWSSYDSHGELLRNFKNVGGLKFCPDDVMVKILKWLVLAYIGESGGRTSYGNIRHVYYSNVAAPLVKEILTDSPTKIRVELQKLENDKDVLRLCDDQHVARRFQTLLDLVSEDEFE